jgi:hypothetical protein
MGMTPTLGQRLDDQGINRHVVVDLGAGASNRLLMRMRLLQLEPDEVMRIEARVFGYLAEACANCTSKEICARDLASATTVTHDWERYCSNAAILRAMAALPWFGKVGSRSRAVSPREVRTSRDCPDELPEGVGHRCRSGLPTSSPKST